ncbi:DUF4126 domain-containing protein [Actinocorallia sp. A-T 12471]|uniref:DUF4126 domain-containing protein n=1 Tax=Actinocorallia sp. A-T 12471 TaxID=3089813 RepID=UPI0029CD638C|nr:DUF4126 domain-containing protein [Actinocorallia sp. A-T 12471]MDX6742985.1 DUF4126 domain-containing protein [Actinocorallia sp. A-T 12471]
MFAFLTGLGLAGAAGLNAYIPILVVGVLARYGDVVVLPESFAWMANGWALTALAVLLVAEIVLDKVPVVDSVNDAVMTFVRPAAGGAVMAASTAAERLDASLGTGAKVLMDQSWVGWVLGIGMALTVHGAKSTVRPVANAGTLGTAAPVLSTTEDVFSLGLSFVAILAPVVGIILVLLLLAVAVRLVLRAKRRRDKLGRSWSVRFARKGSSDSGGGD